MYDGLNEILHSLSPELRTLLSILQDDEQATASGQVDNVEFSIIEEQLLQLAVDHRVYPLVSARLQREGALQLSVAAVKSLQRLISCNTLNMLKFTAEMIEVVHLLEQHNIRSLVLKGPVLAQALYGDLSLRTSKDLDLLITLDQLEAAEAILRSRGYVQEEVVPRIINDLKWKTHHVSYIRPSTAIQIELHWRLNPDLIQDVSFNSLWERRNTTSFQGRQVSLLGPEDLFVYLVSHGSRHGWFRIRWLVDIDKLLRMPLRWPLLQTLIKESESSFRAGQATILCDKLLHTPVPEEMRSYTNQRKSRRLAEKAIEIIRDITEIRPFPNSKYINKRYRNYVISTLSFRQRCYYLICRLYPSSLEAELVPLPKSLHFLYFPLRPILWSWRRFRANGHLKTEGSS